MQFSQYNHWSRRYDYFVAPVQNINLVVPERRFACMPFQAIGIDPIRDPQYISSGDQPYGFCIPGQQLVPPCAKENSEVDLLWGAFGFVLGQVAYAAFKRIF